MLSQYPSSRYSERHDSGQVGMQSDRSNPHSFILQFDSQTPLLNSSLAHMPNQSSQDALSKLHSTVLHSMSQMELLRRDELHVQQGSSFGKKVLQAVLFSKDEQHLSDRRSSQLE